MDKMNNQPKTRKYLVNMRDAGQFAKEHGLHYTVMRDELTDEQSARILAIWNDIGRYSFDGDSLEQFAFSFLCEANPDREIGVWEKIAKAFGKMKRLVERNCIHATKRDFQRVMQLLIGASTGAQTSIDLVEQLTIKLVECKDLTPLAELVDWDDGNIKIEQVQGTVGADGQIHHI